MARHTKETHSAGLEEAVKAVLASKGSSVQTMAPKKTFYDVYREDAEKRLLTNPLPDLYPPFPKKKFSVIYADPPWDYGGKMQFDKSGKLEHNGDLSKTVFISAANFQYPTVKTADLMRIPILDLAEEDCLLFMWATSPHLAQAIQLGEAWGFKYRTVAFVWDKMNHNPGQYTLSNTELCLVFKRGKIPTPRGARNEQQLIRAPRGKHSEKPVEVLEAITRMFPTQSKIELFARRPAKGWTVWGLDMVMKSNLEEDAKIKAEEKDSTKKMAKSKTGKSKTKKNQETLF
jgi:N6-adenosine-specific RNA methylase IME4